MTRPKTQHNPQQIQLLINQDRMEAYVIREIVGDPG